MVPDASGRVHRDPSTCAGWVEKLSYQLVRKFQRDVEFVCRRAFTQPSYWHFVAAVAGIVLGFRRRTVAGILASAGVSGLHHVGFYRFFSQAVWTMDALWKWWPAVVLLLVPEDELDRSNERPPSFAAKLRLLRVAI